MKPYPILYLTRDVTDRMQFPHPGRERITRGKFAPTLEEFLRANQRVVLTDAARRSR